MPTSSTKKPQAKKLGTKKMQGALQKNQEQKNARCVAKKSRAKKSCNPACVSCKIACIGCMQAVLRVCNVYCESAICIAGLIRAIFPTFLHCNPQQIHSIPATENTFIIINRISHHLYFSNLSYYMLFQPVRSIRIIADLYPFMFFFVPKIIIVLNLFSLIQKSITRWQKFILFIHSVLTLLLYEFFPNRLNHEKF